MDKDITWIMAALSAYLETEILVEDISAEPWGKNRLQDNRWFYQWLSPIKKIGIF